MNDVKKYLRYLKRRSQIKISDDYESKKNKLVNDPKYIRIMFVMNEILFESFPQLVLQSAFLYQDIITDRTVTKLKIQQIIFCFHDCMGSHIELLFCKFGQFTSFHQLKSHVCRIPVNWFILIITAFGATWQYDHIELKMIYTRE